MKSRFLKWLLCITAMLSVLVVFYGIWVEPYEVEIHHVWIQDSGLGHILGDKVLVQLSDLHSWSIGSREKRVLEIVNQLNPDIIFLTGDYVPWKGDYCVALNFIAQLRAKIGIWAIMGDYDYSNSRKSCLFCHKEGSGKPIVSHNVRFLRDDSEVLHFPEGSVRLVGIDGKYPDSSEVNRVFSGLNNDLPMIVLCHNPLLFDKLPNDRHIVMLSGDTHGGQVPLPDWFFGIMGYEKNALYNQGLFERAKKRMFVSRGIGWSHLPIRIFRRPEVVVLHFKQ